jgi:SAM-dependent methyltransferase
MPLSTRLNTKKLNEGEKLTLPNYVCPSCGEHGLSVFYEVKSVPVNSCLLLATESQAVAFPRGDIALGFCKNCGFISNVDFDSSKVDYSSNYEDQQCYSSKFNTFAQTLANSLIEKYNLYDRNILEIGCGKGDFLASLCELGQNTGVGIDPAYTEGRIQRKTSQKLTFIRDFYSERYSSYNGDLICCRHTLEHIPNTSEFVNIVRRSIDPRRDTAVFFEVPDVTRVLREVAFWDIYYEHCSYFSPGSLARLFRFCNFSITDLYKEFDDQYLIIEAKLAVSKSEKTYEIEETVEALGEEVKYFAEHFRQTISSWKNRLEKLKADNKRVAIWGSGSKCVAFITTLNIENEIDCVIDINPHRHGKFIPGAGKQIMPPDYLKTLNPDFTIVINPAYTNEIRQMLEDMKVTTEIIPI